MSVQCEQYYGLQMYPFGLLAGTPGSASSDIPHHMDNNTDRGSETSWETHLKSWPINRPPLAHTGPPGSHGPSLFPSHPAHSQPSTPAPPRTHPDGLSGNPMGAGSGGMPGTPTPTSVSNATSPLVVPQPMKARTIKTYHCRMCDQEFHNKSEMTRHSKDVHGMEEKGHKCPKCFKSFPTSQQLAQHSLVHSNIRKFHCQYCDKTFKQLSHVQQHQRIHTGERPYKCTVESCGKAFAQLANLQQHLKNHDVRSSASDKKPYSCSTCDRRFATEASLNHHVTKVHLLKPRMALASPSTTLASNTQPLVPVSTAAMVTSCGYIHNALSPVPFSYSGFDFCMLGALAAGSAMHAVGQNVDRIDPNGLEILAEVKQEVVDVTTRRSRDRDEARHGSDDDDDDRENLPGCSPVRSPAAGEHTSRLQNDQTHDDPHQSHDVPVLREAQPLPEQSPLWSGSRLMELSKKDLNLLKLSSDKLYSFPTQVPPLNSLLYMDKPLTP